MNTANPLSSMKQSVVSLRTLPPGAESDSITSIDGDFLLDDDCCVDFSAVVIAADKPEIPPPMIQRSITLSLLFCAYNIRAGVCACGGINPSTIVDHSNMNNIDRFIIVVLLLPGNHICILLKES